MGRDTQLESNPSPFFEEFAEGLPLTVRASATAGRGMYAAEEIAAGEVIQDAAPIVAHPTLNNIDKCCYLCLKYTQEGVRYYPDGVKSPAEGKLRPSFCSEACALYAEDQFYGVEQQANWTKLVEHGREHGLRFPLLVARLACMVLSEAAEPDVLRPLCFVKTDPTPPEWVEEHSIVYQALRRSGQSDEALRFLTLDWYVSVIARMHLNSFQVDIVRPLDPSDLFAAASDAAAGHGSAGSAVYLLPSMYNHSCEPSVDIHWPRDAIARFEARRDIQEGEELTITYIDASLPVETRQKHLEWAYGFRCQCQRCQDEKEPP
ncbi:hypothetical protein KFL_000570280 [Klebsormidium nitens]|uniref:SET domain-containing protein n=1 Tax=Klebsormidium nitens TaxID=105231 RepID=A0A0U9HRV8_KLENI|nr:hypothetical protein KFL_000570280 [Klebsormidium nitens]|eukprot:GAQ80581.1 hypothetical protein KFL_000570280 [Klebsormidium nitens]